MTEQSVAALIQQREVKFIETRTIIENEVNKFLQSLLSLDADVQQKVGAREGITAKDLLPALWADPFDEATYNQQLSSLMNYIAQVQAICDQINQEARACLQS